MILSRSFVDRFIPSRLFSLKQFYCAINIMVLFMHVRYPKQKKNIVTGQLWYLILILQTVILSNSWTDQGVLIGHAIWYIQSISPMYINITTEHFMLTTPLRYMYVSLCRCLQIRNHSKEKGTGQYTRKVDGLGQWDSVFVVTH